MGSVEGTTAGASVDETTLGGVLPRLTIGSGPPLVVLTGLSPEHRNPTGLDRSSQVRTASRLAGHHTVHLVGRRPGLPAGSRMRDLAADVADAIRADLEWPIPVVGMSTGGSIALQLAVDQPGLVKRLVLLCAACRLGPGGRRRQRALADLTVAGRPRRAWAGIGSASGGWPLTRAAFTAGLWLAGRGMDPDDPADMLATIEAEDGFDVTDELHRVTAPTLVVGGARDGFYTPALFERTARGILGARLLLYPRKGHVAVTSHRPALREIAAFLSD